MSTEKQNFGLEILPAKGGYTNGFTARAHIGGGDFKNLELHQKFGDAAFKLFKQFDRDGLSNICTASAEDVKVFEKKKLKFVAVAALVGGNEETSDEVEVQFI